MNAVVSISAFSVISQPFRASRPTPLERNIFTEQTTRYGFFYQPTRRVLASCLAELREKRICLLFASERSPVVASVICPIEL